MLWGALGLAGRGAVWGAALCLPFVFMQVMYGAYPLGLWFVWPFIFVVGFAMPLCYFVAIAFAKSKRFRDWQGRGWELGEALYGALLWASWCYFNHIGS
jgi:uncharacterized membrane protein YhaH (DUF805 family)